MRRLLLLLSLGMLAALGASTAALAGPAARPSVVGGIPAGPGSWSSAAFIADLQGNQGALCTGTVVAPRVVLTAAHCVTDATVGDYHVVTGTLDWSSESQGQTSDVTQTATFP